jgi:hypothetical protein
MQDLTGLPTMWIKRSSEEVLKLKYELKRRQRRRRLVGSIVVTVLSGIGATVTQDTPLFFAAIPVNSLHELLMRLPIGAIFGLLMGMGVYFARLPQEKMTVICLKCGKVQLEDKSTQCSCGGTTEDVEKMKWIEDN